MTRAQANNALALAVLLARRDLDRLPFEIAHEVMTIQRKAAKTGDPLGYALQVLGFKRYELTVLTQREIVPIL